LDEEERKIAQQLLGIPSSSQTQSQEEEKEEEKEEEEKEEEKGKEEKEVGEGGMKEEEKEEEEDEEEASANKEKKRGERRERKAREKLELALISEEEKISLVGEVMKEQAGLIDKLTGFPKKEDILLFALPVCAPYSSLQSYKYKVKLTPGKSSRSTARKNALYYFLKVEDSTDRENELIKNIPESQFTSILLGDVSVSIPLSLKTNKKAGKKKKK